MKALRLAQFGNPILRQLSRQLSQSEIASPETQMLIENMRYTLISVKLGVGLAAPQVGAEIALTVIVLQPTAHRPDVEPFEAVLINPIITKAYGRKQQLWEGCISSGKGKAGLFAKVPRYKRVKVRYIDERGASHHKIFEGLRAHVVQHEVDHLNGVLFVDKVKDTTTYMTYAEYVKLAKKQSGQG